MADFKPGLDHSNPDTHSSRPMVTSQELDSTQEDSDPLQDELPFSNLSSRNSLDILESSDTAPVPLPCPYEVGKSLMLRQWDQTINAVIKKVYRGGAKMQFSNSCPVLLETQDSGKELVLKIFDWRYMQDPRELYGLPPWNFPRSYELHSIPEKDVLSLKTWLLLNISHEDREHELVQDLCNSRFIPQSQPTNLDLYGYLRHLPTKDVKLFADHGLIPRSTLQISEVAQQEIFLYALSEVQLAAEDHVSRIVNSRLPSFMPRAHGVYDVSLSIVDQDPMRLDESHNNFQVRGLLMDEAPDQPVAHLPPYQNIHDDQTIRSLSEQLTTFQLGLWRCDLEFLDVNLHNLLLSQGPDNNVRLMLVDYGAVSFVVPDADKSPVRIKLPSTTTTIQLPEAYSREFFDCAIEVDLNYNLVGYLTSLTSRILEQCEMMLPRCFGPSRRFSGDINRFVWCNTMLHIIHPYDEDTFYQKPSSVLRMLRIARQTMVEEYSKSSSMGESPWWSHAVRSIAEMTNTDPEHAMGIMAHLTNLLGPNYVSYQHPFALTQLHAVLADPDMGPMFRGLRGTKMTDLDTNAEVASGYEVIAEASDP